MTIYYEEYSRIQRDKSADTRDKDLFVFAMYYDFMSCVAQQLRGYFDTGVALAVTRRNLIVAIKHCDANFRLSKEQVSRGILAIVESIPELSYIKDYNSDFQVQRSITSDDYTNNRNMTSVDIKESLVGQRLTNDSTIPSKHLRRGANALQGLISSSKRQRNKIPVTPRGLQMTNDMESSSDEYSEGSESASPAFDPTSSSYSVETTESSGKARTQGQGATLEFTHVREPKPAFDFVSEERTDMSMFIAQVAMNSAQLAQTNWIVDSGARMSGTSSTTNLKDTTRCRIPITPAFGAVMNATCQCKIRLPTQVYMVVYEDLGYLRR